MSSLWGKQDVAIMSSLQQDSTVSTAALAERLNSSQSPVWRRINRLEEKGVVQRRVAYWIEMRWVWKSSSLRLLT